MAFSIPTQSVTKLHGPEWGAAKHAAELVEQALDALEGLNIGAAKDLLAEALDGLPVDNGQYYYWPGIERVRSEVTPACPM